MESWWPNRNWNCQKYVFHVRNIMMSCGDNSNKNVMVMMVITFCVKVVTVTAFQNMIHLKSWHPWEVTMVLDSPQSWPRWLPKNIVFEKLIHMTNYLEIRSFSLKGCHGDELNKVWKSMMVEDAVLHGWWTPFRRNGVRNDLCDWFASISGAASRRKPVP